MPTASRHHAMTFYGVVAVMAAIVVLSVYFSLSWINRPFAGFLVYHPPYAGSVSLKGWPGVEADIRFLERIVSVEGRQVTKGGDVTALAAAKEPGSTLRYVLESEGERREVPLAVSRFRVRDYLLTSALTVVGGVIIFGLGIVVYLLKPGVPASWVFLFFCLFLGTYMVSGFEILSTYHLVGIHYAALSFMGTALFHLGLLFPVKKDILEQRPSLAYLLYVPSLILTAFYEIYFFVFPKMLSGESFLWMPSYRSLGMIARAWLLTCVLGMVVSVVLSYRSASSATARQRARIILFGASFAFIPCAALQMAYFIFRFDFPWNFLVFFIVLFPAAVGYAIARHNLFDADAILKRAVGYACVSGVVVAAYAGVSIFFNMFLGSYQISQSRSFPVIFTLGVIMVFNPLRDRIQAAVDRIFFRTDYDYGAIVEGTSRAMTSLLDLDKILRKLANTFVNDLFLDTGSIMLLGADGEKYHVFLAEGAGKADIESFSIGREQPLMQIIENSKHELTKLDVLEDPKYMAAAESCVAGFDALHASMIVPLLYQDKVIGSLNLGEKKSGKGYKREDVDLYRTIASQGAVAIENARLFQDNLEKQRMEEELNIARDLQISMLPAECPQVEGFQIAASSTPAKEVGGDFYDFIDIGEGKIGIVVGDVTGKSVSGALVMSASRSIFRMLSEEKMDVGEIMAKANRRTKADITKGMFVALLYVILDAGESVLRMCSAGQTLPVHISGRTGEATLVETLGDTFPIGIVDDPDYQETTLRLDKGDRIFLYTDGIVEAMNAKGEMFGFDRFVNVAKSASEETAEGLRQEIIHAVSNYAEGTPQHDDLTVIVINAQG